MTAQLAPGAKDSSKTKKDANDLRLAIMGDIERILRSAGKCVPDLPISRSSSTTSDKSAVLLPLEQEGSCLLLPSLGELVDIVVTRVEEARRQRRHRQQAEGIEAAKARGVKFGRAPLTPGKSFLKAFDLWQAGKITTSEAARLCGMCRSTFHVRANAEKTRQKLELQEAGQ